MTKNEHNTDILVVGAGPAGLATTLSALRHGARVLTVERRPGTSTVPRATGVSAHTMELFRAWGVGDAVREASMAVQPTTAVRRTLADKPYAISPLGFPSLREVVQASPELPALCSQDVIEPLLLDAVRAHGGEVSFGTPLTCLSVEPDGSVYAVVGGRRVRATYVVGADGPRSPVRSELGIGVEHLGTLGDFALVVFRADLSALSDGLPYALNLIEHAGANGVLLPAGVDRWIFSPPWPAAQGRPEDRPAGYWVDAIRVATGLPTLQPHITAVSRFTMAAEVASAYRSGPGFLVGDAAHRMTPVGGRGMNTAVHDGHELGWRLAWAVRGLAGEALLDSYQAERAPVGRTNAERSLRMGQPDPGDGLGADLFARYRSDVIAADSPQEQAAASAIPGGRAPHVWVRREGRRVSTLDLFEGRLTLLTGAEGSAWAGAAERVDPPVQALVAGVDLTDPRGALQAAYRLDGSSAVLVRPDGVVAWRHDGRSSDPTAALAVAVDTALGRVPVRQAVAA